MVSRFGMRSSTLLAGGLLAGIIGVGTAGTAGATTAETAVTAAETKAPTATAVTAAAKTKAPTATAEQRILLKGSTTASYFWDDSSGVAGDTGLPASGREMQKGLAASPSWPLLTEGYVTYKGKKAKFFVGDRGPGEPSEDGVMLDLDTQTFAYLTGGTFNSSTRGVDGIGGEGHIDVEYHITKWGNGVGTKNYPLAYSTGAWGEVDHNPATPPAVIADKAAEAKKAEAKVKKAEAKAKAGQAQAKEAEAKAKAAEAEAATLVAAESTDNTVGAGTMLTFSGILILIGGGLYFGGDRLRLKRGKH